MIEASRGPRRHAPLSATIARMSEFRRRSLLLAALLPAAVPEGGMVRAWLDFWSGVGYVVDAMHAQGYDARLCQSPFGWRVEFCRTQVNTLPKWVGTASAAAPWRAVQRAACPASAPSPRLWPTTAPRPAPTAARF